MFKILCNMSINSLKKSTYFESDIMSKQFQISLILPFYKLQ